ncbi:MAG: DUF4238 domain-containing protein [Chitinophagaceae bacterium]|nr:DUF4238 domain-containing protein [Chitinophagaceae bacterium]
MKSEKEKQHFVPKFYLKKFSNQNDERSVGVFLKDKSIFIKCASIEGQSQKPYYYGDDGKIENILMEIEGPASRVFNKICENCAVVKTPVEDYFRILHFTVNLYLRNPVQSQALLMSDNGFNNHFAKYESSPEIKSLLDNKLTATQSIIFSLAQSPKIARICLDLSCKLIINKTAAPFITSDNPAIKYNIIADRYKRISAGFTSYGLQMFLPLSPTLMLLFYDSKAYKVKEDEKDLIWITNNSEVSQLNLMQVLNCSNCLYFNQAISESEIISLINRSKKYPAPNEIIPTEFGSYFFQAISELKINLSLTAIQPLIEQHFSLEGQLILPMRQHAKKMREFFNKEKL